MDILFGRQISLDRLSSVGDGVSMTFEEGPHAYIVENGRNICEATMVRRNGEFCIVWFNDKGGAKLRRE